MSEIENTGLEDIKESIKHQKDSHSEITKNIDIVDMSQIKFEKADVAKQQQSLLSIFNTKPSFQVTCSQSGYMAKLTSMVYRDIVTITNSNLSNYENKKEIYKILYSKIQGYSAEKWKPSFEEWLKATALGDVETLFYGLYCATFQEKSTIRFECPWCEKMNTAVIDNKRLIRVDERKEMFELTNRISKEADTIEKIKEFSSVSDKDENKTNIRLPKSKIIFTLKMPSLYKTLDILKTFTDEEIAKESSDALNVLLSTDAVAIPDSDGVYSYIESKKDIYSLLDILDLDDFAVLKEITTSMLESKRISYCIEKQKCSECGQEIAQIPLDIESLLFFQISERQLS